MPEIAGRALGASRSNSPLSALGEDILTVLLGRELYGLQISRAIEESSSGSRKLSIGSLYPTLRRLEEKGYIISHWESNSGGAETRKSGARRRYYRITSEGSQVLSETQIIRKNLLEWQPC